MRKQVGHLTLETLGDRDIVMTRVFDAPRKLVFEAMTKPEILVRWFSGAPGWTLDVCEFEARVGGKYRYVWKNVDGRTMGMGGVCLEIEPPNKIVCTEKFDESWYPGEAVNSMVLTEKGGKTTLTLTVRYDSKEARDAVLQTPMASGVALAYDNLADLLAAADAPGAKS